MPPISDDEFTAARARIAAAYDPAALEAAGKQLIATLTDHFRRIESRDGKVLNWNQPAALITEARRWLEKTPFPSNDVPDVAAHLRELVRESLARGQNLHHPHYVGHQVPAPIPLAALVELAGTITNQAMA